MLDVLACGINSEEFVLIGAAFIGVSALMLSTFVAVVKAVRSH